MSAVVVAGASGFVGRHVVERLLREGADVRCGTRDPGAAAGRRPDLRWVRFDVDADDLGESLVGADALVYLVHHMQHQHGAELMTLEAAAAKRVVAACERAGVRRIVYLGGPVPGGEPSPHLRSRLHTGDLLRSGRVSTIELRAAMIVGAGSESWTLVRDLALRLPIMVLPSWLRTLSSPIDVADVADAIAAAVADPRTDSAAFDLPGPEVLTARAILERVAAEVGIKPVMIPVPVLTPKLSAHWLRLVCRGDHAIARQLVDGLTSDLVPQSPGYWAHMGGRKPTPLGATIRKALADDVIESPRGRMLESFVRRVARRA